MKYSAPSGLEVLRYLTSRFKLFFIALAIAAIGSVVYALLQDNVYKSTANLFPAEDRSVGLGLLGGGGGGLSSLAGGLLGSRNRSVDRLYVLLGSESISRRVIDRFNLLEVYELQGSENPYWDAINELQQNTQFRGLREGNFLIEVWDTDKERARDMANYYVELVSELNTQIASSEATLYREFIQNRYQESLEQIESLRQRMKEFQQTYGVFELPEQVKANIEVIGQVVSQQVESEAKVALLRETIGTNNDLYRRAVSERDVLRNTVDQLYRNTDKSPLLLSFDELPEIADQYTRLMQDIEVEIQIQRFMLPLFEQARLEEQKALPVVTIIDAPRIAERKDKPFRALIVLGTLLSVFILLIIYLVIELHIRKNRDFLKSLLRDPAA
ncbi:MAG: hypothetical protein LAT57_12175 [Balneolales bacterium]|nr:hypothetical protein [Balneolales bacterium]